jgi:hypothetical protein
MTLFFNLPLISGPFGFSLVHIIVQKRSRDGRQLYTELTLNSQQQEEAGKDAAMAMHRHIRNQEGWNWPWN